MTLNHIIDLQLEEQQRLVFKSHLAITQVLYHKAGVYILQNTMAFWNNVKSGKEKGEIDIIKGSVS